MPKTQTTNEAGFLKELGLDDLPIDRQVELLDLMTRTVLNRMTVQIYKKLDDREIRAFEKLKDAKYPEKIHQFLRGKIKGYDQMVEKVVADFKQDIKNDLKNL